MSNLVDHAKRELELCGQTKEDPAFAQSLIDAVQAFSNYGHSGGSAMVGISMLHRLLLFENLSPLTSNKDEWLNVAEASNGEIVWQSKRNPKIFSNDPNIKTYYNVDEPDNVMIF